MDSELIEKAYNQLKGLKQNQNLSHEELRQLAINKAKEDEVNIEELFVHSQEKKLARQLLKKYLRDYYCTSISKSSYYYHPVDLLYLSGTLSLEHEVSLLDALCEDLTLKKTIDEVKKIQPHVIICLVAAPSFNEDLSFLSALHRQFPTMKIIGTGDVFRESGTKIFESMPFLHNVT